MATLQAILLWSGRALRIPLHFGFITFSLWDVFVFTIVGSIVARAVYAIFHFYND